VLRRSTTQPTAHSTNRKAPELPKSLMAEHRASIRWGLQGEAPSRRQARPPPYTTVPSLQETSGSRGASDVKEAMPVARAPSSQKPQVSLGSAQAPEAAAMDSCNMLATKPQYKLKQKRVVNRMTKQNRS
jgi:hypothetical protein